MDLATRNFVRARAGYCCEYCGLPQSALPYSTFHVEHIRAKQHFGSDDSPDNLALACAECNLRKGPNLTGIDPETDQTVPLFNPRQDLRSEHFILRGNFTVGLTPTGRATVFLLAMNSDQQIANRSDPD
jgi:HNH endonuclease